MCAQKLQVDLRELVSSRKLYDAGDASGRGLQDVILQAGCHISSHLIKEMTAWHGRKRALVAWRGVAQRVAALFRSCRAPLDDPSVPWRGATSIM